METVNELKADIYIKNLETISHISERTHELANLWKKDRQEFFNHLAAWFENNLGASDLSIIYNDLKMPEKEDDKPELVKALIVKLEQSQEAESSDENEETEETESKSETVWEKKELEEAHHQIFKEYEATLKLPPRLLEISEASLTFGGSLTNSPFLLVCKFQTCGALQQALLKGLFSGLEQKLTS